MIDTTRNEVIGCIDDLSEKQLDLVLQYIKRILAPQSHKARTVNMEKQGRFIEEYIGGISHGTLADNIDGELYG